MASHIDNLVTSLYNYWISSHKPIKIYSTDHYIIKEKDYLENGFKSEMESFNITPKNQKRVLSLFWIRIQKDSYRNRYNTIGGFDKAINWRLEGVKKIAEFKLGDEIICSMSYSDYNEKVKIILDIINRYLKSLDNDPSPEPERAEIDPMFKAISAKMLLLKKLGIIDLLDTYIYNETGDHNKKSLVNLIAQVINDGRISTIERSITALSSEATNDKNNPKNNKSKDIPNSVDNLIKQILYPKK